MTTVCKKTPNVENQSVVFEFQDANKTTVEVMVGQFSAKIQLQLMLHGLSAKLGDAFSGSKGSVSAAASKFRDAYVALQRGEWNSRTGGILLEAFIRQTERSEEECRGAIAAKDEKQLKKLREDLAVMIKTIETERAVEAAKDADEVDFDKYF